MATETKTTTRRRTTSTRKTSSAAASTKTPKAEEVLAELTGEPTPAETTMPTADIVELTEQPELKKRELIEMAVERSGVKKRDAKPAIEAVLAILGEALAEGRELNLQPLGKLKVTRMKKGDNGQIINARVRQPQTDEISDTDPLAHAAE
ncbi:HU family DNA-binding protein [Tropicibacter naphthalenivorans]|uniref:Bacterial DNA-binding protein n=1 Tax=Tropicibacter naphthalenivorans TaxID=441103 RepID=A0A0P1GZH7_9RHOB|nr:HU family DNA-binding protein [Tropicibacter naphthalenivorans]CUH80352.1 Bacterial DNA-binding protein [Tropicibacter naphthalenivorans]SMC85949.1 DNA-binding protein HU-alpha [Tropicibacter naphthalenivorans]